MPAAEPARSTPELAGFYASLRPLCVQRMTEAFVEAEGLFAGQIRAGRWEATTASEAITSTAVCLIAMSRAGLRPADLGVDKNRCLKALAEAINRRRYIGAIGLALWANAVQDGPSLSGFLRKSGLGDEALTRRLEGLTTMETAWLLSGLLHEQRRNPDPTVRLLSSKVLAGLLMRQERTGLFVHATASASLRRRLRRLVSNFADQIYPVQALAFAAMSSCGETALSAANRCMDALASRRGELSQWWWQYDPRSGQVSRRYPVYSVHQYGMAPMAILTLAAAAGHDHAEAAWRGLRWLHDNELTTSMVDENAGTIWRDIRVDEGRIGKLLRDVRVAARLRERASYDPSRLCLNRETRPYEWGWCVMAGAQLTLEPPAAHIA